MTGDIIHLFLLSLFMSLVTFGGGAQALFYQYGVVGNHWITNTDLTSVLAWGYATPGPAVFTTATFIGYHLGGIGGAVIGTIGIFILPFLGAIFAGRYLTQLLQNPHAEYFVRGVGLAAAGLVAATALGVIDYKNITLWQVIIMGTSCLVALRRKINPLIILIAGALLGLMF